MPEDLELIAARQAVSLARKDLNHAVLTLPYVKLGPEIGPLRMVYDAAQRRAEAICSQPCATCTGQGCTDCRYTGRRGGDGRPLR